MKKNIPGRKQKTKIQKKKVITKAEAFKRCKQSATSMSMTYVLNLNIKPTNSYIWLMKTKELL
jgi:hypothetical protein